jgi:uncharacterized protein (DUF4415 family)
MSKKPSSKKSQTDKNRLRALKDEDIDISEIPELHAEQLTDAKLRFGLKDVPEGKTRVNMFLDNAIVHYFKMLSGGRGYQTLINETLAEYIRREELEDTLRRVIREELERKRRAG